MGGSYNNTVRWKWPLEALEHLMGIFMFVWICFIEKRNFFGRKYFQLLWYTPDCTEMQRNSRSFKGPHVLLSIQADTLCTFQPGKSDN